jgi:hypothetical protein
MTVVHWQPPDALSDILSEAWRRGLLPPSAIHVRPEVHARILTGMTVAVRTRAIDGGGIGDPHRLPLVIDDTLPACPGYEIHRSMCPALTPEPKSVTLAR